MKIRHGFLKLSSAALITAAALVSCGLFGGAPAASGATRTLSTASAAKGGEIVIGDADDLTGNISLYGQWTLAYLHSVIDYVNAHGGVGGKQIQLDTVDVAAAGQSISSGVTQLLDEHATMLFGATESSDCDTVVALVTAHKVPMVCTSVALGDIQPVHKYVFAAGISEPQEAPATAVFLKNTLKLPAGAKVAVVNADSAGAEEYGQSVLGDLKKAGYDVVTHQQTGSAGITVGGTTLSNVVASHPDAVVADMGAADGVTLFNQLRAQGNDVPVIVADAQLSLSNFAAVADSNLYGINVAQPITSLSTKAAGTKSAVSILKRGGLTTLDEINEAVGTQDFPPIYSALEALKACKGCSGAKLAAALEHVSVSFPGLVSGNFSWSAANHVGYTDAFLIHYDPKTKAVAMVGKASALTH